MKIFRFFVLFLLICCFVFSPVFARDSNRAGSTALAVTDEQVVELMHGISSHQLFDYVKELCLEKYGGRLTGTTGYNAAADWVAGHLNIWGVTPGVVTPGGDKKGFFQDFPNPYTLVKPGARLILHGAGSSKDKVYVSEDEFMPGSTSDTGKITAEVVYVGYGISAPGLDYDDYKGLDVKGKIVLVEREVPVSPSAEPELFKKWRPYSFHQYKVKNAAQHGAAGFMYNYHIANPNCLFIKGLIFTAVGQKVVDDVFQGTGKTHEQVIEKIKKDLVPQSFATGKKVTIEAVTEHHPEGIARNVIGMIAGIDEKLKDEPIIIGAHLDHLGFNDKLMPGADDNASGVAVVMGVAEALAKLPVKPKRSIVFIFFGAEEQGVKGSEFYLQHAIFPVKKTRAFINLDGVGRGTKIRALAAVNYPELWKYFETANQRYIHRVVTPLFFHNRARPRLDAAHFMWAGVPSISFSTTGGEPLPYNYYHRSTDNPSIITPEIMEDLAQLIFLAVVEMAY